MLRSLGRGVALWAVLLSGVACTGSLAGDTPGQSGPGGPGGAGGPATPGTDPSVTLGPDGKPLNQHDILTGSTSAGRAFPAGEDKTCNNWTSNSTGSAQLGHFDRTGGGNTSWNSAHGSKGCSNPNLVSTGGNGYLYCFAEK